MEFSDIIGLTGAVFILVAYLLLQLERTTTNSIMHLGANIVGALLIMTSLLYNWNLSSFIIEVFWLMTSIFGLYRALTKQRNIKSNFLPEIKDPTDIRP